MPYSYRPGMVNEGQPILNEIVRCIGQKQRAIFKCGYGDIQTNVHRMHNLLAATNVLRDEANGKFVGLRGKVKVSVDTTIPAIVVEAKAGGASLGDSIQFVRPDESTFFEAIRVSKANTVNHKFWPSPDFRLIKFEADVNELGYELARHHETGEIVVITGDDGSVMLMATRTAPPPKPRKTGFSGLDAFRSQD